MSLIYNTNTRNQLAAAFGNLFNGGTLEIRTSADVVLATINLPNPAFGSPNSGTIAKNGTWQATASASGVASKAVFISSNAENEATETIGESNAAIIIDNENIVSGGTVTVSTYTYTVPAS